MQLPYYVTHIMIFASNKICIYIEFSNASKERNSADLYGLSSFDLYLHYIKIRYITL